MMPPEVRTEGDPLSSRLTLAALVAVIVLLLPGSVAAGEPSASAATKPNIVLFYIDDVAPIDGRLWNNPELTPTVYDLFVAHGVTFTNAIGETPLCCPGRGSVLTGLHTQNDGVIANDARLLNPGETIATELKGEGYATMWVGKYLNWDNHLGSTAWQAHGQGWTYLDAISGPNGDFYGYTVHTKTGNVRYGHVHSTRMATERTIAHMQATPAGQPIFSVVSLFNMHGPNIPMPDFQSDPRWAMCAQMPPWDPPNYNEADVSDKPTYVQSQPLLPDADGWSMTTRCREALGIDWSVSQVTDELAREGRLDNTLLVFTADNGMTWGAHRLKNKQYPYATPVPLYMSWPARWGDSPRTTDELVSNIDLAPTFCAAAGCEMGPYPTGQQHADGISLLPYLDGDETHVRDAALESNFGGNVHWVAVRTAPSYVFGPWHYVEWTDGERELYDLRADPWELGNRAADPAYQGIAAILALRLHQLLAEGIQFQPDAMIVQSRRYWAIGDTIYSAVPLASQTKQKTGVRAGSTVRFHVRVTNDGGATDSFTVIPTITGSAPGRVRFIERTPSGDTVVNDSGFVLQSVDAHQNVELWVEITFNAAARRHTLKRVVLTVTSQHNPARSDVVRLVASR
jgi:N-acetylglucosamine-6-sulfatase